jgi:hypothetical protein
MAFPDEPLARKCYNGPIGPIARSVVRLLYENISFYSRLKKLAQSTDHEPKTAERPDWVELIGSTVTRIPEFSYGTIARPIRP